MFATQLEVVGFDTKSTMHDHPSMQEVSDALGALETSQTHQISLSDQNETKCLIVTGENHKYAMTIMVKESEFWNYITNAAASDNEVCLGELSLELYFPEKMIIEDFNLIKDISLSFAKTGEMLHSNHWEKETGDKKR